MEKMVKEIWKTVKGHPFYKVSNLGRVKSLDRTIKKKNGFKQKRKGIMLKPLINNVTGYASVVLNGNKRRYIHRLVLEAFVKNPNPKVLTTVNHINSDRKDCRLSNLEYVSQSENIQHSYDSETGNRKTKISNENARYIVENYIPHDSEFGGKPLAKRFGVSQTTIYNVAKGIIKTRATLDLFEVKKAN